jgi:hypothetical protein
MSRGLELFSTEVNAAQPEVIVHVPPNELYLNLCRNVQLPQEDEGCKAVSLHAMEALGGEEV